MRGFIGALLVIPALASRSSEPWDTVDDSPLAGKFSSKTLDLS